MAQQFGPDERRLLENAASKLFEDIVSDGDIPSDDPRFDDAEFRPALELLIDLGLLNLDSTTDHYVPADPAAIQSRVVAPMGQRGADLIAESSRWAEAFTSLGQSYRRFPVAKGEPITELRGVANINRFIAAIVADAQSELLTAQPQVGRSPTALSMAAERDVRALERGVAMRTLYQHSARRSTITAGYVTAVSAQGAEVRTLEEFFNRLIVVDRSIAIVPGQEGFHVAVAIRDHSLVAYLVDIFDRFWERARPFTNRESQTMSDIAADVRATTIRMLIEGHSDPTSAKRLGVSTRTYAAYIAELKEEYEAQTRFQLGYAMGQRDEGGGVPETPSG